jgi:glutaminase
MAVLDHEREVTTAPPAAPSPIAAYLLELLERIGRIEDGDVASYIPELATADPTLFGICLTTADGAVYEVGDTRVPFTIQSMSKPLTYGIALEQLGDAAVRSRVGVEPSGDAFNEISLAPGTGAPLNPMINAGAIACAALVGDGAADPFAAIVDAYSAYAGRRLEFDEAVYLSERETGHRNRAIVHLLRNFGVVAGDPEDAVDLYFRQCSLSVDCRDLAGIAATLANGGVNPVTGERAVRDDVVRSVLSVMTTCGMYDSAGDWLVSVGLPAKSGVSGGVLAVLPGRLGIGVYSPRLDESGNSVRGIAVCRELSRDLALHLITPGQRLAPAIRSSYTVAERGSKRVRHADELVALAGAADRTAVFELQGEFGFTTAEAVSRAVTERESPPELVVLDLRRVTRVDRGGIDFVTALASYLELSRGRLALSHAELLESAAPTSASVFADLDGAIEWCESELLLRLGACRSVDAVPPDEHELLRELGPDELAWLLPNLGVVSAPAGSLLVRRGDPATEIFLVTGGSLSVVAQLEDGRDMRLSTVSAGMTFGEVAYVTGGSRTADVRADSEVECRTLSFATIEALAQSDPPLHGKLLRSLIRVVVSRLLAADAAVAELAR